MLINNNNQVFKKKMRWRLLISNNFKNEAGSYNLSEIQQQSTAAAKRKLYPICLLMRRHQLDWVMFTAAIQLKLDLFQTASYSLPVQHPDHQATLYSFVLCYERQYGGRTGWGVGTVLILWYHLGFLPLGDSPAASMANAARLH